MKKLLLTLLILPFANMSFAQHATEMADGIYARFVTNKGIIVCQLEYQKTPMTVGNFVGLAEGKLKVNEVVVSKPFFDGLIFHRVIPQFMIQGGDPTGTGMGGPGYRFADELPKPGRYEVGSLVMANAGPDTNGSQFFVVTGPSGVGLPPDYALFGKVIKGIEVATAIQEVATGPGDRPTTDVVIESVTVAEAE